MFYQGDKFLQHCNATSEGYHNVWKWKVINTWRCLLIGDTQDSSFMLPCKSDVHNIIWISPLVSWLFAQNIDGLLNGNN
jgi:hypothetical protein